jgi:hypothetical protein
MTATTAKTTTVATTTMATTTMATTTVATTTTTATMTTTPITATMATMIQTSASSLLVCSWASNREDCHESVATSALCPLHIDIYIDIDI